MPGHKKWLLTIKGYQPFKIHTSKIQNFYTVFTASGFSIPLVRAASFIGMSL
jgi:hypothetical protein